MTQFIDMPKTYTLMFQKRFFLDKDTEPIFKTLNIRAHFMLPSIQTQEVIVLESFLRI